MPTNMDLAGFWDMVHIQVEQIHTRFLALQDLKALNWVIKVISTATDNTLHKSSVMKQRKPLIQCASSMESNFANCQTSQVCGMLSNSAPLPPALIMVIIPCSLQAPERQANNKPKAKKAAAPAKKPVKAKGKSDVAKARDEAR